MNWLGRWQLTRLAVNASGKTMPVENDSNDFVLQKFNSDRGFLLRYSPHRTQTNQNLQAETHKIEDMGRNALANDRGRIGMLSAR